MDYKELKKICNQPKLEKMRSDKLYALERNISVRISWALLKLLPKIKPNYVTFFSFFLLLLVFFLSFIKTNDAVNLIIFLTQLLLLYSLTITDKIDGAIARAKNYHTQKGMYYDRTVHFIYPFVFYFAIGYFFYFMRSDIIVFSLTLLLAILTINLISFVEARYYIIGRIKESNIEIRDYSAIRKKPRKKLPRPLRLTHFLTYMIYAWTLFYYVIVAIISYYDFQLAYYLYLFQIILSLIVIIFKSFYSYPAKHMLAKDK